MKFIDRDTFEVNGAVSDFEGYACAYGTVVVNFQGKSRRVPAQYWLASGNIVTDKALTGRYRTGTKAWPATISSRPGEQNDYVRFGFDSRCGRHHKVSLSWAQ